MTNPKIRTLAQVIDGSGLPGHDSVVDYTMRQAIVQSIATPGFNGLVNVLFGDSASIVTMPYIGFPPGVGEVCWVQKIGSSQIAVGTTSRANWKGPWNAPWGELYYAEQTSGVTGVSTTETDITATASFTIPPGRILEAVFHCGNLAKNTNGGFVKVKLTDAINTGIQIMSQQSIAAGDRSSVNGIARLYVITGATTAPSSIGINPTTLKVRAVAQNATADFNANAGADPGPMTFSIRDIGSYWTGP